MSCERDDEQLKEFLGDYLNDVFEQDVVNAHAPQYLQHLAHANQHRVSLYHTMTSSCLQGLPFHTPVYNISIACVQVVV